MFPYPSFAIRKRQNNVGRQWLANITQQLKATDSCPYLFLLPCWRHLTTKSVWDPYSCSTSRSNQVSPGSQSERELETESKTTKSATAKWGWCFLSHLTATAYGVLFDYLPLDQSQVLPDSASNCLWKSIHICLPWYLTPGVNNTA